MADSSEEVDLDQLLADIGATPSDEDVEKAIEEIENLLNGDDDLSGELSLSEDEDEDEGGGAASVAAWRRTSTCKGCNGRGKRLCHICKGKGTCKRGVNCSGAGYLKAKCMRCKGTGVV